MCSRCSANKAPIKYLQFERVRVCTACFDGLRKSKLSPPPVKMHSISDNSFPPRIPARARAPAAFQEERIREHSYQLHTHPAEGSSRLAGGPNVRIPQVEERKGRRLEEELVCP